MAYGGLDVIYNWHPVKREYRRVRLLVDVLGRRVGTRSFVGWTYDRFLMFALITGSDYFDPRNLPNMGLATIFNLMAGAVLPPSLIAPADHPRMSERPAAWYSRAALKAYIEPVLKRLPAPSWVMA